MWGAYFYGCKRDMVVVIKLSAYIHGVLILLSQFWEGIKSGTERNQK